MKVETMALGSVGMPPKLDPADQVNNKQHVSHGLTEAEKLKNKISSEELYDRIKALTDDGQYSIQFEMNEDVNSLVIRVVNRESGELVRQIPSEELIHSSKALQELRGLMVDTES